VVRFVRLGWLMPACLIGVYVLTACSDSKPAVCTDVDNLQESVQSLRDVTFSKGALSTISADISQIKAQLATTKADAKSEFSSELTQLSTALDTVSARFGAVKSDPTALTLAALATSVSAAGSATQALKSAVADTC